MYSMKNFADLVEGRCLICSAKTWLPCTCAQRARQPVKYPLRGRCEVVVQKRVEVNNPHIVSVGQQPELR